MTQHCCWILNWLHYNIPIHLFLWAIYICSMGNRQLHHYWHGNDELPICLQWQKHYWRLGQDWQNDFVNRTLSMWNCEKVPQNLRPLLLLYCWCVQLAFVVRLAIYIHNQLYVVWLFIVTDVTNVTEVTNVTDVIHFAP